MTIVTERLGFREMQRLISFIDVMLREHFQDCNEAEFGYDLHYDEPYIIISTDLDYLTFWASDYDYGFTLGGYIERI